MSILPFAKCRVGRCAGVVRLRGELFEKSSHFQRFNLTSDLQKIVGPDFFVTLRSFIVRCHLLNFSSAVRSRFLDFVICTRIFEPYFLV